MIDGFWLPQSEEEERLLGEIFRATRQANANGVPRDRIASLLAFQAAAALDPKATDSEPVESRDPSPPFECPTCEAVPDEARASIGTSEVVLGCGHTVDLEDLDDEATEYLTDLIDGGEEL